MRRAITFEFDKHFFNNHIAYSAEYQINDFVLAHVVPQAPCCQLGIVVVLYP